MDMSDIVLSSKDYVDNNAGGSKFISDSNNTLRIGVGKDDTYANDIKIGESYNPSGFANGPTILVKNGEVEINGSTFQVGPNSLSVAGFINSKYIQENADEIHLGLNNHSIYISGPIVPENNGKIQLGAISSTDAIVFALRKVGEAGYATLTLDSVDLQKLRYLLDQAPTKFSTGPAA